MTNKLIFRKHALQRSIAVEDVRFVLTHGKTIIGCPNDQPYPSRLMLGWRGTRSVIVGAGF